MDERYDFTDNDDTEPEESDDENRPVPKYMNFKGPDGKSHRYELASQDIYDEKVAVRKAKSLSANGYYETAVIFIQGAWRVYAHRAGFKK